jgi:hypothetical protein
MGRNGGGETGWSADFSPQRHAGCGGSSLALGWNVGFLVGKPSSEFNLLRAEARVPGHSIGMGRNGAHS